MKQIYTSSIDSQGKYYLNGPGPGGTTSYYGNYLYPETRFKSEDISKQVEFLMNIAYAEGYKTAQFDIQKSLGIFNKKDFR